MQGAKFDAKSYGKEIERAAKEKNPDILLSNVADDVQFSEPMMREGARGRADYREWVAGWIESMSDVRIEMKNAVQSADGAAMHMMMTWKNSGKLTVGGRTIPATGKQVKLPVMDFVRLNREGKIVEDHMVYDTAELMRQLGVSPEQARAQR